MADDSAPPSLPKKSKLPPLSTSNVNETDGTKKVVKKKKKKPATDKEGETTQKTTDGTPRKAKPVKTQQENGEAQAATTEPPSVTPRKKKKKAAPKTDTDTQDKDAPTTEEVNGSKKSLISKEGETPRKKIKKKKKVVKPPTEDPGVTGISSVLRDLQDDIVSPREKDADKGDGDRDEDDDDDDVGTRRRPYNIESVTTKSQPLQKIFIETSSGFKGENRTRLEKRIAEEEQFKTKVEPEDKQSTIDLAISTHKFFGNICLFLHGLTAGMSLWHIVIVYILLYFDYFDFISHYRVLALPVQCMFYLLLVLCTVSACDRFDIANINRRFVIHSLSMQTGTVAIFIYLASLIVSLCTANLEDRINLFSTNVTAWQDNNQNVEGTVTLWRDLNTARCVLAIVGWIVISIVPNTDRLADGLRTPDDNILGNTLELIHSQA